MLKSLIVGDLETPASHEVHDVTIFTVNPPFGLKATGRRSHHAFIFLKLKLTEAEAACCVSRDMPNSKSSQIC